MIDGYPERLKQRPPTLAEMRRRDKYLRALRTWVRTQNVEAVRKAIPVRSRQQAVIVLNQADEWYRTQQLGDLERIRLEQEMDLVNILHVLRPLVDQGDMGAIDRTLKVWERRSRLHGSDMERAREEAPGIVVEFRLPEEREPAEIVESTAVEIEGP